MITWKTQENLDCSMLIWFYYILACHATLTESHGEITSFGFPTGYYNLMDCTWLIQRSHGELVEVQIIHFVVESDIFQIFRYITFGRLLKYFRFVKLTLLEILVMIHSQFMMVDLNHLSKLVNIVEIHSLLIRSFPQAINCYFILKQFGVELIVDFRLVMAP